VAWRASFCGETIMKYLVQLRLKPGCQDKAMELFEQQGPNRTPGVSFRQAWINTRSHVVFAVVESDDASHVDKAAQSWARLADLEIHPVIDMEQF
jgi:Domain of unknown function (DUF3303)